MPPLTDGVRDTDQGELAPPIGPVTVALLATGGRCIVSYVIAPGVERAVGTAFPLAVATVVALAPLCVAVAAWATWRSAAAGRRGAATVSALLVSLNLAALLGGLTR